MTTFLATHGHFMLRTIIVMVGLLLIYGVLVAAFTRAHNSPRQPQE